MAVRAWFLWSGKVRENQISRVQKLTEIQKKIWTVKADCVKQFKILSACFAHRLFVSPLLNVFRHPCFWCDCKRLKVDVSIGISCEQISRGKRFILSWKVREKSGKMNSAA